MALASRPRFSVVIPTRNRAATLRHSLQTCISQSFGSYELIVGDNCSSSDTRVAVEATGSPLVKYVRSETPLAMSDSWEFALKAAQGEFVIIIGDDDGLMPRALEDIDVLLRRLGAKALKWAVVDYYWPDVVIPTYANRIRVPFGTRTTRVRSRPAIAQVATGLKSYTTLPMIYHGAIHRDLIEELRQRTGRVFNGISPDVYSGFAFAALRSRFYRTDRALSLNGGSGNSSGLAAIYSSEREAAPYGEMMRFNKEQGYDYHSAVPATPVLAAAVASEFWRAKEALFADDRRLTIDRRQLIERCLHELACREDHHWEHGIRAIRDLVADDDRLRDWFEARCRSKQGDRRPYDWTWTPGAYDGHALYNGEAVGVGNVADAAEFCKGVLSGPHRAKRSDTRLVRHLWSRLKMTILRRWRGPSN